MLATMLSLSLLLSAPALGAAMNAVDVAAATTFATTVQRKTLRRSLLSINEPSTAVRTLPELERPAQVEIAASSMTAHTPLRLDRIRRSTSGRQLRRESRARWKPCHLVRHFPLRPSDPRRRRPPHAWGS